MKKLSAIKLKDRLIDLSPSPEFDNFFPIDSVNLVMGRNGSGKTHLLKEIIKKRSNSGFLYEINNVENDESTHVIYFSPISGSRITRSGNGFTNSCSLYKGKKFNPTQFLSAFNKNRNEPKIIIKPNIAQTVTRTVEEFVKLAEKSNSSFQTYVPTGLSIGQEIDLGIHKKNGIELEKAKNEIGRKFRSTIEYHFNAQEQIIFYSTLSLYLKKPNKDKTVKSVFSDLLGSEVSEIFHSLPSDEEFWRELERNKLFYLRTIKPINIDAISGSNLIRSGLVYEANQDADLSGYNLHEMQLHHLSSGEIALANQIASLYAALENLNGSEKNILILIDEGDALLHIEWQCSYLKNLLTYLSYFKQKFKISCLQLILSTHSPVVASDFPAELITNLDEEQSESKTFAGHIDALITNYLDAPAIGEFAAEKINNACEKYIHGRNASELEFIKRITDNILIKNAIERVVRDDYKV